MEYGPTKNVATRQFGNSARVVMAETLKNSALPVVTSTTEETMRRLKLKSNSIRSNILAFKDARIQFDRYGNAEIPEHLRALVEEYQRLRPGRVHFVEDPAEAVQEEDPLTKLIKAKEAALETLAAKDDKVAPEPEAPVEEVAEEPIPEEPVAEEAVVEAAPKVPTTKKKAPAKKRRGRPPKKKTTKK